MGKSKLFPLVLHDKTEVLCFGLVGLRGFCRSLDLQDQGSQQEDEDGVQFGVVHCHEVSSPYGETSRVRHALLGLLKDHGGYSLRSTGPSNKEDDGGMGVVHP